MHEKGDAICFVCFGVFRGLQRGIANGRDSVQRGELAIIGACFSVYKDKGCGFLEPVYHECCEIECAFQKIPFLSQTELELTYRGQILRQRYKPDFICFQKIIVELKPVSALADEHRAQQLNYLHATEMKLGLLVNFGHHPKLEYERIVL
jgi:GxxExxY protein